MPTGIWPRQSWASPTGRTTRTIQTAWHNGGQTPAYVREFAAWMTDRLAPRAVQAHPTDEHLLPLYVALGAAADPARIERFHAGIDDYVLAMDAYTFLPKEESSS